MQTIRLETRIAAPPERCFLLCLNVDLHLESAAQTRERAIAGVTHGILAAGESVTWEGRHFGFVMHHTIVITQYERPHFFQDSMTKGMFETFEHDHHFCEDGDGTLMRDVLRFSAPLGILGAIAEKLTLSSYLERFLLERNALVTRVAESDGWRKFI
jgi:ligand-binding SRPBCC domain-containing protein